MKRQCILTLTIVLLFCSCAKNIAKAPVFGHEHRQYPGFLAPEWFWNPPTGPFAIGIAWDDGMFGDGAIDVAREFASVSLSRNQASFVVDKSIIISLSSQNQINWDEIGFNMVVSADLPYMYNAFQNMKLIDSYSTNSYLIALFGLEDALVSKTTAVMSRAGLPDWCNDADISADHEFVYSVANSHHVTLMDAYYEAQELALKQIGKYRLQNVMGRVLATDNMLEKSIAIETVTQSKNSYIDKVFVVFMRNNQSPSYKVYIRLKADI